MDFISKIFGQKNEYIGLSSFKATKVKKQTPKKEKVAIQKTSLTGLIKRAI